jgi:hypothetical protein
MFETFSFLPPLSDDEIAEQVRHSTFLSLAALSRNAHPFLRCTVTADVPFATP